MGCVAVAVVFVCLVLFDAPWWSYLGLIALASATSAFNDSASAVTVPKIDLDEIRDQAKTDAWAEMQTIKYRLERWEENLKLRERILRRREQEPERDINRLTPGSIRIIRNNLMKHHEGKAADPAYQASATCKETTHILQGLNKLIDQKKIRA